MANGRCRMHGGTSTGAPIGNSNAWKHGHYTAEAAADRQEIAALIRSMKGFAELAEEGRTGQIAACTVPSIPIHLY